MAIFKKRRKSVEKSYAVVNTKEDFGFDIEIQIAYWDNPSRSVLGKLIKVISTDNEALTSMDESDQTKFLDEFFGVMPDFILESDLDGLEFDTKEQAIAAFEHPELPMGFMYTAVVHMVLRVLTEGEYIKNALTALPSNGNSGSVESDKAQS